MGAHHFDVAQWALDMDTIGPVRIEPPADGKTTGLKLTYASGVEMFHGGPSGCTFEGTDGALYVDRDKLTSGAAHDTAAPTNARNRSTTSAAHRSLAIGMGNSVWG